MRKSARSFRRRLGEKPRRSGSLRALKRALILFVVLGALIVLFSEPPRRVLEETDLVDVEAALQSVRDASDALDENDIGLARRHLDLAQHKLESSNSARTID